MRRRIEEVVASFLCEGLAPAETMIGHLIEMEGVEIALNQQRIAKTPKLVM